MASASARSATTDAGPAGRGELVLGLAGNELLRWATADVTGVVEEARRRLDLSPLASVALGRALAASALMSRFFTKLPGRLVLEVLGDGPLGKVVAEVDSAGQLRGLVDQPHLATPEDGRMSLSGSIGKGILRITREGEKRYSGQVELVSGEIGKDLAHYLHQSEQIHSAVLLGVLPKPEGIVAAGGTVVEALPGAEDEIVARLEANIARLGGVSRTLEQGGIRRLNDEVLAGLDHEVRERYPLRYGCRCSRDKLLGRLVELPIHDLESILDEDDRCVAECAFCGALYTFERDELLTTH